MLLTIYYTNMLLKVGKPSMYQAVTCLPHSLERIFTQNYTENKNRKLCHCLGVSVLSIFPLKNYIQILSRYHLKLTAAQKHYSFEADTQK